jgi:hypothetical protein
LFTVQALPTRVVKCKCILVVDSVGGGCVLTNATRSRYPSTPLALQLSTSGNKLALALPPAMVSQNGRLQSNDNWTKHGFVGIISNRPGAVLNRSSQLPPLSMQMVCLTEYAFRSTACKRFSNMRSMSPRMDCRLPNLRKLPVLGRHLVCTSLYRK